MWHFQYAVSGNSGILDLAIIRLVKRHHSGAG